MKVRDNYVAQFTAHCK